MGDGPLYVPSEGPIEDQNSTAISVTAQTLSGIAGSEAGVSRDPAPHTRYVYAYLDPALEAPESQVDSARIELTVNFTALGAHMGKLVRYLTAIVEPGITFNQFAQLRGNLRLDEGAFQEVVARKISADCVGVCEERAQTGLPSGEFNQSQVRSRLQKILIERFRGRSSAITNVVGGFPETISETLIERDDDQILYYKRNGGTGPFRLIIDAPIDNIPAIEPTTIVCEGCDIYINANVSNDTPGIPPTIKLGLIALEDPTIRKGSRGGNIFLHANVTETALHIYADGSFMSYSGDAVIDDEGIPQFGTANIRDILDNQYTNYGRIRSNNTLGGSTLLPAITGEGELATGINAQALQYKARMQDLNFLRYAKTVGNRRFNPDLTIEQNISLDENRGPPFRWVDSISLSLSLGALNTTEAPAAPNYPLAYGIVNFFDSSSSGLPIFEALSTVSR